MAKITSKDIEAIREYRDKLEALNREPLPTKLTPEEWDEAMKEIQHTGKIPAKYKGHIGENEIEVRDGMERMLLFMILHKNGRSIMT